MTASSAGFTTSSFDSLAAALPGQWIRLANWSRTWRGGRPPWNDLPWPSRTAFGYYEDFLVAEPQLALHLNVTDWLRIGGGAGYRFVAHAGRDGERLQGLTASFGLQVGPP